jgi:hypothetical protein
MAPPQHQKATKAHITDVFRRAGRPHRRVFLPRWQKIELTLGCLGRSEIGRSPQLQQVQASNGYYTPITTNCYSTGYGASCYQSGGQYIPPIIITVDTNRSPRNDAARGCFYSNGWAPVSN